MTVPSRRRRSPLRALIALYPRSWRERYGAEFGTLLDETPAGPGLVIDVLFGVVDARVRPQASVEMAARPVAPHAEGEAAMASNVTKFTCPGYGANVTRRDAWIGAGITLGGTLALTLAWMVLHVRIGDNPYLDSFTALLFLGPFLMSMPFTSLKGRPRLSQVVFIGGLLLVLVAIALLAGFVASRI